MSRPESNYCVATIKPWNISAFHSNVARLRGNWTLLTDSNELTLSRLLPLNPRYVFFPHWSWKVPSEILAAYECVGFHMSDVPYGRGGSPLQNLIQSGHRTTMMSALRMVDQLDAGPVYLKRQLQLDGRAQDIFENAATLIYEMIGDIIDRNLQPVPQAGEVVIFNRRVPEMSELPKNSDLPQLFDHIRMLDADTYPRAYLQYGDFRVTFRDAELHQDSIYTRVVIERISSKKERT